MLKQTDWLPSVVSFSLVLSCKDLHCHEIFYPVLLLVVFQSKGFLAGFVLKGGFGAHWWNEAQCHSIEWPNAKGSRVQHYSPFCICASHLPLVIMVSPVTKHFVTLGWRPWSGAGEGCWGAGMSHAKTDCSWILWMEQQTAGYRPPFVQTFQGRTDYRWLHLSYAREIVRVSYTRNFPMAKQAFACAFTYSSEELEEFPETAK